MIIEEVKSDLSKRLFIDMIAPIYANNKTWVRPIDKDIEKVFDAEQNKYFSHGECTRWILWNAEKTIVIGRVAAFINERTRNASEQPTGGMGFFECVDNKEAAFILLNTCKEWLAEKGIEAMDGPINFGERNQWWGLLVDGYDERPTYQMNYHPPYYKQFFEEFGFQVYFYQYSYGLEVTHPRPEKYVRLWNIIKSNKDYEFTYAKKNNLEKYAEDFRTILNAAWAKHDGFREMTSEQAMKIMKTMKPIMVEHIMQFAYYKGRPIAMYINIPELNQFFKHVNGKLDLIGKLKTFYYQKTMKYQKFVGIVFGVIPEFQGKGIEGMMVMNLHDLIHDKDWWREIEMTWIGDFNPKMMNICVQLGAKVIKTHATYRYLFDRTKEFHRAPIIH
jgi:hypothetical protein